MRPNAQLATLPPNAERTQNVLLLVLPGTSQELRLATFWKTCDAERSILVRLVTFWGTCNTERSIPVHHATKFVHQNAHAAYFLGFIGFNWIQHQTGHLQV